METHGLSRVIGVYFRNTISTLLEGKNKYCSSFLDITVSYSRLDEQKSCVFHVRTISNLTVAILFSRFYRKLKLHIIILMTCRWTYDDTSRDTPVWKFNFLRQIFDFDKLGDCVCKVYDMLRRVIKINVKFHLFPFTPRYFATRIKINARTTETVASLTENDRPSANNRVSRTYRS